MKLYNNDQDIRYESISSYIRTRLDEQIDVADVLENLLTLLVEKQIISVGEMGMLFYDSLTTFEDMKIKRSPHTNTL